MDTNSRLDNWFNQYKLPLVVGLVGLVLLIGGAFSSGLIYKTFIKSTKQPASSQVSTYSSMIKVDVSGAVMNPGVYSLPTGSRIEDAIKAAGGVSEEANEEYLTQTVNLAQKLNDGVKIYIPSQASSVQGGNTQNTGVVAGQETQLININIADLAELDSLSGVGPVTAQKIIDGRPYQSIEELYTKKSVNRSTYEKIKDKVKVY